MQFNRVAKFKNGQVISGDSPVFNKYAADFFHFECELREKMETDEVIDVILYESENKIIALLPDSREFTWGIQ